MQFIDEQQDSPLGGLHLCEHCLQPFLELAPILRARDQRSHVEREDGLVAQTLRYVTVGDPLSEPFHNRCLPDPRIADEHRVVLGLARQDLYDPAYLTVPAYDGVEPPRSGVCHQVTTVFFQSLVRHFWHCGGDALIAPHRREGLQKTVTVDAFCAQQPASRSVRPLIDECDEQVLDGHVLVLQPMRLSLRRIQQPGQPLGDEDLTRSGTRPARSRSASELCFHLGVQPIRVGAGLAKEARREPVRLIEQCQQQMFAVDLGVTEPQGFRLGVLQRLLRLLGQCVRVHLLPPSRRVPLLKAASSAAIRSSRSTTSPSAA